MRIDKITLYNCERPFFLDFVSSRAIRAKTEAIILRIDCCDSITGFGESTPRHYVTGETIRTVSEVISNIMAGILLGREVSSLSDIRALLADLSDACRKRSDFPFNSALGAVDLAMMDILGKKISAPVREFLGPIQRNRLPFALSIPLLPLKKIRALSGMLHSLPITSFKIVAGTNGSDVLNRLRFIREEFGFKGEVTLDANGIWTADQACDILNRATEFEIAAVEQPTARDDHEGLRTVRKKTGIPVVADESLCSLSDAQSLIRKEACDIINIKISKCGGLLRSEEIARFAHTKGIPCQIGAHVGETEILSAAGLALAQTVPVLLRYDGFSSLLFGVCENQVVDRGASSCPKRSPGLGVEVQKKDLIEIWSSHPTR